MRADYSRERSFSPGLAKKVREVSVLVLGFHRVLLWVLIWLTGFESLTERGFLRGLFFYYSFSTSGRQIQELCALGEEQPLEQAEHEFLFVYVFFCRCCLTYRVLQS